MGGRPVGRDRAGGEGDGKEKGSPVAAAGGGRQERRGGWRGWGVHAPERRRDGVWVTGPRGTVDEWKAKPGAPDNHWLDCLVGCAAAASMLGVSLFRGAIPKKVKRKRKHVVYL